jgi:hypothetical protein
MVKSEDRSCQQKRLRHIIQQPACHIVDMDYLIRHQRDTAHDEQYRTGVLRDFEAFSFKRPYQCHEGVRILLCDIDNNPRKVLAFREIVRIFADKLIIHV